VDGVLGTRPPTPARRSTPWTARSPPGASTWRAWRPSPTDYRDDLDYIGYLNAPGRPTPTALPSVKIDFDPQAGWAPGQIDTNAPSDHYPVEAAFQLN